MAWKQLHLKPNTLFAAWFLLTSTSSQNTNTIYNHLCTLLMLIPLPTYAQSWFLYPPECNSFAKWKSLMCDKMPFKLVSHPQLSCIEEKNVRSSYFLLSHYNGSGIRLAYPMLETHSKIVQTVSSSKLLRHTHTCMTGVWRFGGRVSLSLMRLI